MKEDPTQEQKEVQHQEQHEQMQQEQHTSYEFFGPHGPAALTLLLPATVYGLHAACNSQGCLQLLPNLSFPGFPAGAHWFSLKALAVVAAYITGKNCSFLLPEPCRKVRSKGALL